MPDLLHQSLAETVQAELRGVIDGHLRVRVRARERRDVYDVASAALLHLRNCLAAAIEDAEQICLNNSAKFFRLCFIHTPEDSYASVVDQNVHTAELRNGVLEQSFHLIIITHVANDARNFPFASIAQLSHGALDFISFTRAYANVQSFAHQSLSNRSPDSLRAS